MEVQVAVHSEADTLEVAAQVEALSAEATDKRSVINKISSPLPYVNYTDIKGEGFLCKVYGGLIITHKGSNYQLLKHFFQQQQCHKT